jgi:CBS domain-containing protein
MGGKLDGCWPREEDLMFVERMLPAARKRLVTIGDDAPLIDAAKLLLDRDTDLVVVCRSDEMLAGVITKTDVVRQISHCQGSGCATAASTVMTRTVILCHPSDLLQDVWSIMKERGLKNIPVVDQDSRPIGVLNARDALEVLLEEVEYEEVLLREYVMCVGYH